LRTRIGELFGLGDWHEGSLVTGRYAGSIDRPEPAGGIVENRVRQAEETFRRLASVAS
jgi:hypothetical protein